MIVCIDDGDTRSGEFFDDWEIDPRSTEHISLQNNTDIESSFFGSDDSICQLRSISPGIYLDPDTMLGTIDASDEISLGMSIWE